MDCEMVEMEEQDSRQQKTKVPRRTIYFASGETMEEYSTDEEEEEDLTKKQVATVDTVGETCIPPVWTDASHTFPGVLCSNTRLSFGSCYTFLTLTCSQD